MSVPQYVVQLPLSRDEWASLRGPFPLSADEWDQMMAVLQTMKPGLVGEASEDQEAAPSVIPATGRDS